MMPDGYGNRIIQNEIRIYGLTQDQADSVDRYLESLVRENKASQLTGDGTCYKIFPSVHGGYIITYLEYETGVFKIEGESSLLGRIAKYMGGFGLGPLRLEGVFKREEVESP